MMVDVQDTLGLALAHTHGNIDDNSRDEVQMYKIILNNLCKHPNTKYHFHFNMPITDFGVPSKSARIQDYKDRYIEYVMKRCMASKTEAVGMMRMVGGPIRTNTLLLDVGKTDEEGNLIAGLESNRGLHYNIPDNPNERADFARSVFADMIKEIEIGKIASFVEVNHCIQYTHGIGSEEYYSQNVAVLAFVNEL